MALYRSLGARPDETRGTTALEVRKDLARLFTGPGVLPGADSPLVVGSDVFAYVVRSAGWVTSRGEGDGVHLWGNDGDLTVSEADDGSSLVAPAPGLSRIDVIYALHPSADENGDTTSEPVVAVRKGIEASVPVAPGLPVGGLELARNTMTSAATSTSSAGNTIAQTAARADRSSTPVGGLGPGSWSSEATGHRYADQTVALEGRIVRSGNAYTLAQAGGALSQIGSLAASLRPRLQLDRAVVLSDGRVAHGRITPGGTIYLRGATGSTVEVAQGASVDLSQFGRYGA